MSDVLAEECEDSADMKLQKKRNVALSRNAMRAIGPLAVVAAAGGVLAGPGCASGVNTDSPGFDDASALGANHDATMAGETGNGSPGSDATAGAETGDGSPQSDSASETGSTDASASEAGGDSALDAAGDDSGALDPGLVLPAAGGAPCTDPGLEAQCPTASVCRIASPTGGRCESCAGCGNLHAACTTDADCDILFQCYNGSCDPFCQLSVPGCTSCVNVGNATTGICN